MNELIILFKSKNGKEKRESIVGQSKMTGLFQLVLKSDPF